MYSQVLYIKKGMSAVSSQISQAALSSVTYTSTTTTASCNAFLKLCYT